MYSIVIQARRCVQEFLQRVTSTNSQVQEERMAIVEAHIASLTEQERHDLENTAREHLNPFPTDLAIQAMVRVLVTAQLDDEGKLPPLGGDEDS